MRYCRVVMVLLLVTTATVARSQTPGTFDVSFNNDGYDVPFLNPDSFATPLRLGANDVPLDVALYPNPTAGAFTLSFTAERRGLAAIEAFGVDGRRILLKNTLVKTEFNAIQMDGTGWSAGAYNGKIGFTPQTGIELSNWISSTSIPSGMNF